LRVFAPSISAFHLLFEKAGHATADITHPLLSNAMEAIRKVFQEKKAEVIEHFLHARLLLLRTWKGFNRLGHLYHCRLSRQR
jgi:hypothetical protein